MRIEFTGRNLQVPEPFEEHAEKRLRKLARLVRRMSNAHVVLFEQRGRTGVEITSDLDGTLIRTEVLGPDARTSFDLALDKLERQIVRYKEKLQQRSRNTLRRRPPADLEDLSPTDEDEEELLDPSDPRIVRTKSVSLKPMSPEEAALQMELLGHDFFLFKNADTDLVAVVYKRKAGDYGLLECET